MLLAQATSQVQRQVRAFKMVYQFINRMIKFKPQHLLWFFSIIPNGKKKFYQTFGIGHGLAFDL